MIGHRLTSCDIFSESQALMASVLVLQVSPSGAVLAVLLRLRRLETHELRQLFRASYSATDFVSELPKHDRPRYRFGQSQRQPGFAQHGFNRVSEDCLESDLCHSATPLILICWA